MIEEQNKILPNLGRMKGRTAIITGGGKGIGEATAINFASEQANVVIFDVDELNGKRVADYIQKTGSKSLFIKTDVSNEEEVKSSIEKVYSEFNSVDVLVNNAAIFIIKKIEDTTSEEFDKMFSVNIKGYALMIKHCAKYMKKQQKGAIVNLASISSHIAQQGFGPYTITKTAILGITRSAAIDLAPFNIRVNSVSPGTVKTPALYNHIAEMGITDGDPDKMFGNEHMISRCAEPSEIAKVVLFLASDEASFITAEDIAVDGGLIRK